MPNDGSQALLVNQGAFPPYTEASRTGTGWTFGTATALTPLAAFPTTTAALEIWNGSGIGSGIDFVADSLYAFQLLSTAATQTYAIYAQVTAPKVAPTNTALTGGSLSGRGTLATATGGQIITGLGTTVIATGWRPWGSVQAWGTAAATPGNSWSVEIAGRLVVPPSCSLCLHIVGSIATASSFQVGASFYIASPLVNVP